MNPEILTITLPDEKHPVVDVKQRFEVSGIIVQARLTLINNVLPVSAVQQEESTDQRMERMERSLAERKPDLQPGNPGLSMGHPVKNPPSIEPKTEKLLTSDQAAEYIGVHVETLRKWARSGKIPRMSLPGKGNRLRFSKPQLDKWIADRSLKGKNLP